MTDIKIFDSLNCSLVKEDSIKVQDISSQGAVGGEVYTPVQEIVSSPAAPQVGRSLKKQGDRPVVKPEKKQIKVRIPGDKDICSNTGCCHLSDGTLVVTDYKNSRLKRVDPFSSKVTKYCSTYGHPWDVCCIGPQEVAVAVGSTLVHVYNKASLTRARTVNLGHRTDRIACHDDLLYCAGWYDKTLYVHDVSSGRKLREIRPMDTDGWQLFSNIKHIAVNSSGDRVYVTDYLRGLVCVSAEGRLIFHISDEDLGLSHSTGVTTDQRGHVFVCGLESHNVVKVTGDCHMVGQILSKEDGIKSPGCLSYDVSRRYLYVGGSSDQLLMVEWK